MPVLLLLMFARFLHAYYVVSSLVFDKNSLLLPLTERMPSSVWVIYMNLSANTLIIVISFSVKHTLEPSHFLHTPLKQKDKMMFDEVNMHFHFYQSTFAYNLGFVYKLILHLYSFPSRNLTRGTTTSGCFPVWICIATSKSAFTSH